MDDILFEREDRLYGIVARAHHKIGGIEVDRNAVAAERIKKCFEDVCFFGACFHSKMPVHSFRKRSEFTADFKHALVLDAVRRLGDDADMRRHDIRAELLCHL